MIPIKIDRTLATPIYRQIVDQVQAAVKAGSMPPGARLPPVRTLADELGITRLTVYSAYSELQAMGLVASHVGRGTYVADRPAAQNRQAPAAVGGEEGFIGEVLRLGGQRGVISFAQAFPAPEALPAAELGRALQAAARQMGALEYGPVQGHPELREEICALLLDRGVRAGAEDLLITAGAQQAIDIVLRSCTAEGDTIAVEEPTYPGVLEAAALRGLRVAGVPADEGGIRIDALERVCAATKPRLLYLIPTCGNPAGRTLRPERRAALLAVARAHDLLVVEDDVYGFLAFDPPAPPALQHADEDGRVIYLMSFSKILAPALRLGAIVAPPAVLPRIAAAKGTTDLVCSSLLQVALARYLRSGHLRPHLATALDLYRERCAAMSAAIARFMPDCVASQPEGGLSMWVRLPPGVDERETAAEALSAGVAVIPGRAFFPQRQDAGYVRLGFGLQPNERIEEGIAVLGQVLAAYRRRRPLPALSRGGARPLV